MNLTQREATGARVRGAAGYRISCHLGHALAAAVALGACSNESVPLPTPNVVPPQGVRGSEGAEPTPAAGGSGAAPSCTERNLERRAVWLSDVQFSNSVTRLLGPGSVDPERVPDVALKPFSQKGVVVNTATLRGRLDIAQRAAASVRDRYAEATGCGTTDDACARSYVQRVAEEAFRHPLAQDQLTDLLAVYTEDAVADIPTRVSLAVQAIVAAPSFSYRTEFGGGSADAQGKVTLTDAELGSLLSYWLTDSPPDAELRTAMAQGRLSNPAEVERQVSRLLATPEAQNSVTLTLMSAWLISNVFGSSKDPTLFPDYGPLLQSNMFEETRLFLNRVLWDSNGTLGDALTSHQSYVNQALANLYEVPFTGPDPTQFVLTNLPEDERAGLLTQASFLAGRARSDNTSVVARGLFVRTALLCLPPPPPPPENVLAQVQALLAADLTEKERAEVRATTSPCNGCHGSMDAFGLMLENYDPIGKYREELEGAPIDATVDLTGVGFPGTFEGVTDFVDAASESTDFTACVARHLTVYATGNDAVASRDCELAEFKAMAPETTDLAEIVTKLATSTLLRTRSGGAQ